MAAVSDKAGLKRDDIRLNRHRALAFCLSMISAQTRSAFVARENRYTLFRIHALAIPMLVGHPHLFPKTGDFG
jgi:hypothetical protein